MMYNYNDGSDEHRQIMHKPATHPNPIIFKQMCNIPFQL